MSTRFMPARQFKSRGRSATLKQQLPLGGDMATCEAARVLHAVKQQDAKRESAKSKLEDSFDFECRARGLPPYKRQLLFAKEAMGRRWKFDFAWPQYMLAVELDGLVMRKLYDEQRNPVWVVMGGHATIDGIVSDHTKGNAAIQLGWSVLHFEQKKLKDGTAIAETMRVLVARGWQP